MKPISQYEPEVLRQSVVVFSQNYLPVGQIDIKRAIALLITGRAEPLEMLSQQTWQIISPQLVLQVPEHIRLTLTKSERFWRVPPVARREVLRRDNHTCQYCGSNKKLTIDHVIPRAKGGLNTWENVVIACESCNHRKGNRTPQEANMPLRIKPKAPMHPTVAFAEKFWRSQQENNSG
ncbi:MULTISPECIES: HNH endonuclease [Pseudanabaena]|uniref:HNH endonuclease n=2 Tax=Pseudanabaena TaxID=1152 RepID=L8MZK6_9CYAN|nr:MULTISPECIES: HNH endonuclease [Pseudanabaena]ELS32926.1 HNH endonuclease [Pseudanabaena biceps PCC 7429]MDG3494853.1 HNH endonuclease [Pseudanabaena catenata USMAC16]